MFNKIKNIFPLCDSKSNADMSWILKNNCPVCLSDPIETLSHQEYREKYPPNYTLTLGTVKINLCEFHMKELKKELGKSELEDNTKVLENNEIIKDCSTCKNNVEYPPPHTCDICTSLDQEKEYEMWEGS